VQSIETVITNRRSWPKLVEPAPDHQVIERMIAAALTAPDHGRLKPWRFLEITGQGLEALGELFAATASSESEAKSLRQQPLRAPMILVAIGKVLADHKIPVMEQQVAVGCAIQNALLVAEAEGVGSYWRTGPMAFHSEVFIGLGLSEEEQIIGFIYLGTKEGQAAKRPTQLPEDVVKKWYAPGQVEAWS